MIKSSHTEDILNVSKSIPSSYIPDSILFISSFHLKILETIEQIPGDILARHMRSGAKKLQRVKQESSMSIMSIGLKSAERVNSLLRNGFMI